MMRLFGEDELAGKRCMQSGSHPEEVLWKQWIEEDRAVLKTSDFLNHSAEMNFGVLRSSECLS